MPEVRARIYLSQEREQGLKERGQTFSIRRCGLCEK
nr:MAG TPA: hypothetical protein [Caudoviricetes sp.]